MTDTARITPWHPRYWPLLLGLALLWLIARMPVAWWPKIASALGAVLQKVAPSRYRVVLRNLELAFPESSAAWRVDTCAQSYRAVALSLLETSKLWYSEPLWLDSYIEFAGLHHLRACQENGDSVLLLSCHYTAIEIAGAALSRQIPFYPVYAAAKNAYFDQLQKDQRRRFWPDVVVRSDMRKAMRVLRSKDILCMLPDQAVAQSHGAVPTQFFNQTVLSTTAPARLQKRSGAKILLFEVEPQNGGLLVTVTPPLDLDESLDAVEQTQVINDVFEKMIRRDPGQYFWQHKRFKSGVAGVNPYK